MTANSKATGFGSGLRFHQIMSDGMAPTIRPRDYVLVSPAHSYIGEGYYLVADAFGGADAFSCSVAGTRDAPMIRLHRHNKFYSDQLISLPRFEEIVLAQIAMICNVVRPDLLIEARRCHKVEV